MLKTISSSDLRDRIRQVLDEVGDGGVEYIVRKYGKPTVAIISLEDFRLLQSVKQQEATSSLRERIAGIRAQGQQFDPDALSALIEEARAEFHSLRSPHAPAD